MPTQKFHGNVEDHKNVSVLLPIVDKFRFVYPSKSSKPHDELREMRECGFSEKCECCICKASIDAQIEPVQGICGISECSIWDPTILDTAGHRAPYRLYI
jgi:hypothetical protein